MDKRPFLGWIALDIDGTITHDKYSVPEPVISFLRERVKEGWHLAMATGRPVRFASFALSKFDFPYLFLAQNGSLVMEMPAKKILFKRYIPKTDLRELERAFEGLSGDFAVYTGFENEDRVYWRPGRFDEEQTRYLKALWARQKEEALSIDAFENMPMESVPLVKCFGMHLEMEKLAEKIRKTKRFTVAKLKDPFEENYYILLITAAHASKGQSLEEAIRILGKRGTIIAAGDDENDASLLNIADIAIAMAHAPESLQNIAHLIAPPTSDLGIITALTLALRKNGHTI